MIHRFLITAAILVVLVDSPFAPAQVSIQQSSFFGIQYQRGHYSFGGFYAAPVYESHFYFYQWVPPRVPVRPIDDEPTLRPRHDPFPTVHDYAPALVDAAVKRGDLRVFKPGQTIAPPPAPLPRPPVDPVKLAEYLVRQGDEALARGEFGRAGERYRAALALRPRESALWFRVMRTHLNRGEIPEALGAIRAGLTGTRLFGEVESWLRK